MPLLLLDPQTTAGDEAQGVHLVAFEKLWAMKAPRHTHLSLGVDASEGEVTEARARSSLGPPAVCWVTCTYTRNPPDDTVAVLDVFNSRNRLRYL